MPIKNFISISEFPKTEKRLATYKSKCCNKILLRGAENKKNETETEIKKKKEKRNETKQNKETKT